MHGREKLSLFFQKLGETTIFLLYFAWICVNILLSIVRKVDELGRVVLPIELRRNMGIEIKDSLEIFVEENTIILKKYEPADIFTGSMDDLIDYKGKKVSKQSILEMAKLAGLDVR